MIRLEADKVVAAREGDRAALDSIVRTVERPIFNVAMRMLANRADAEDATQEILVKIVTHLATLRDVDAAGAWAFRIACRHLVHERKRGAIEAMQLDFARFASDLDMGLSADEAHGLSAAESILAVEEVKVGCTLAMLVCLSRESRIAYILGEIFEVPATEAAAVLDIGSAAFRQRLRRARAAISAFMITSCGLISDTAACHCHLRVSRALETGRIRKGKALLSGSPPDTATIQARVKALEQGRAAAAVMRSNPDFKSNISQLIMRLGAS